ncbi:hypothetical protein FA95DRAFT_1582186 [Auriscalpium vulgare]|uniref:Uncharacterized protein n=1 Tax=Auriscalpium vulgare TaxID=40419 RepID=A0ACB8RWS9_9AGAM|nr:hypothetical protein FA95DRAFT_1582186 [Auriscalpium vulgare]
MTAIFDDLAHLPHRLFSMLGVTGSWIVLILFLINMRSWPFGWHARLFNRAFRLLLQSLWFDFTHVLQPAEQRRALKQAWWESMSPIGVNPLDEVSVYKTWAGPDDCDYNLHLSNSSYAKSFDVARVGAAIKYFPTYVRTGGGLVVGATHFSFLREIPALSKYEVHVSIATWDEKWLYLVARFVTFPKNGKSKAGKRARPPPIGTVTTPLSSDAESGAHPPPAALLAALAAESAPHNAVLHCVGIAHIVLKQGRVTVPPALGLACEGFSGDGRTVHMQHVREIVGKKGGLGELRKFMRGGWREVDENKRWWEDALGGAVEERRVKNLEVIGLVRKGLEGARFMK